MHKNNNLKRKARIGKIATRLTLVGRTLCPELLSGQGIRILQIMQRISGHRPLAHVARSREPVSGDDMRKTGS
jgi:hypothetical protein